MNAARTPFLSSYIETALWSSIDEHGTPLDDSKYADTELAPETLKRFEADCENFQSLRSSVRSSLEGRAKYLGRKYEKEHEGKSRLG